MQAVRLSGFSAYVVVQNFAQIYFEEESLMETILETPEKCSQCPHCQIQGDSGYYPYLRCDVNMREVSFNEKNGWERMIWCPLMKEGESNV